MTDHDRFLKFKAEQEARWLDDYKERTAAREAKIKEWMAEIDAAEQAHRAEILAAPGGRIYTFELEIMLIKRLMREQTCLLRLILDEIRS